MGMKAGSMQLTFFSIPDPVTEDFWGYVSEHLKKGIFRPCAPEDTVSYGFVSWEDLFDLSFSDGYQKANYLAFQFRLDQKKIPSMIVKQKLQEAISAYKSEKGHLPSKKIRSLLKESVEEALFKSTLPCPSGFEVVWHPVTKRLILGTTSSKLIEAFLEHFERTFRLHPVPLYHVQLALSMETLPSRIKDSLSLIVSPSSHRAFQEGRFLGYEFLTWLWFKSDQRENSLPVYLGDRIVLSRPDDGRERIICTTQNHSLKEAYTALGEGKMVEEAQWIVHRRDNEYIFSLDASLWMMKGVRTPSQPSMSKDGDPEGRFLERMFFIEELRDVFESLYQEFLMLRFDGRWHDDVLPAMEEWKRSKMS
ncbi:MAG: recombination-associated protein RdgC [Syntrophobacterales bacterium]|nr:recombination-associated protein RdgC [Syntrophobacterales bacterium]